MPSAPRESLSPPVTHSPPQPGALGAEPADVGHLRDLSSQQWKAGIAAWLGWLFDGLDMHLYTLVAIPFVAQLMQTDKGDPQVNARSAWIQAAFLIGWAVGGSFFGVIGDRMGRTRALILTILTYAGFTGLSFFAQTWWHLLLCRFVSALGIGGEWAVGASLLAETWPRRWRPWLAAVLQSAVNCGVLLACLAGYLMAGLEPKWVFLVGIAPALLVLWIRRAVPETEEWHAAQQQADYQSPRFGDLFRGEVRGITVLTMVVCAMGLTAHWAFLFWFAQHFRALPDVAAWTAAEQNQLASRALSILMISSIVGNFMAAVIARWLGYRRAIVLMFLGYFGAMLGAYAVPRAHLELLYWMGFVGLWQGVFALFTMYMPPLFPTLLRTTGAGFCYNIGRIAAALGTVFFGLFNKIGDFRMAMIYSSILFLPAAAAACLLPEPADELPVATPAALE